jgi:hypothetical protein
VVALAVAAVAFQVFVRGPELRQATEVPAELTAAFEMLDANTDDPAALNPARAELATGQAAAAHGDYDAARAAFEAGDPAAAISGAQAAERSITGASARGQERLLLGGIVGVSLAGFIVVIVVLRRRQVPVPPGIQPGTAALLALDARFAAEPAPEAAPEAGAEPALRPPPRPAPEPASDEASPPEAVGGSGTLGGHPDAPPPPLGEAPSEIEREANGP